MKKASIDQISNPITKHFIVIIIILSSFCFLSFASATDYEAGANAYWDYNTKTGILTIYGSGRMYDYNLSKTPWLGDAYNDPLHWYDVGTKIKGVIVKEGITYIGSNSFYNFESASFVYLPSTLKEIGKYAFYCFSDAIITIPEGVTTIGDGAFRNSNIKTIILPSTLQSIGMYAFKGAGKLTNVYYRGTLSQWNAITIGDDNDPLLSAEFHPEFVESWGISYEWGYNYSSVTGIRTETHTNNQETETVSTTEKITKEPTCTEKGTAVYTSSSFSNPAFTTQIKTISLEALGHQEVIDYAVSPTELDNGLTQGSHCSRCGETLIKQEIIPPLLNKILTLPNGIKTIESGAFENNPCEGVIIPNNCTSIESHAFLNCKNLKHVRVYYKTEVANDAFEGCDDVYIEITY